MRILRALGNRGDDVEPAEQIVSYRRLEPPKHGNEMRQRLDQALADRSLERLAERRRIALAISRERGTARAPPLPRFPSAWTVAVLGPPKKAVISPTKSPAPTIAVGDSSPINPTHAAPSIRDEHGALGSPGLAKKLAGLIPRDARLSSNVAKPLGREVAKRAAVPASKRRYGRLPPRARR